MSKENQLSLMMEQYFVKHGLNKGIHRIYGVVSQVNREGIHRDVSDINKAVHNAYTERCEDVVQMKGGDDYAFKKALSTHSIDESTYFERIINDELRDPCFLFTSTINRNIAHVIDHAKWKWSNVVIFGICWAHGNPLSPRIVTVRFEDAITELMLQKKEIE